MKKLPYPKSPKKEKKVRKPWNIKTKYMTIDQLKGKKLSPIRKTIKKKPITVSYAKGKAWHAFSEYIRRKYADEEGYVQCYTCTTRKPWKLMQAGHGISGRNNGVLFLEQVVRPQCMACNVFARGRYQVFTFKLIKELGMEEYERLNTIARKTVQYKVYQYQDIEDEYKQRLAHMEDN